jgi:hypothetical protein
VEGGGVRGPILALVFSIALASGMARAEDLTCLSNPWSFTTSFSNGQKPVGE